MINDLKEARNFFKNDRFATEATGIIVLNVCRCRKYEKCSHGDAGQPYQLSSAVAGKTIVRRMRMRKRRAHDMSLRRKRNRQ